MSRPVAEIEAELDALKSAGADMRGAKAFALRAELKAAKEAPPVVPPAPEAPVIVEHCEAEVVGNCFADALGEGSLSNATPDPLRSDEMRFVEKCIAETKIEFGGGNTTGAVKKIYNDIDAKVKAWRIIRDIVSQVGVGSEWPQWVTLGRDAATGRKTDAKPAAPVPAAPSSPPAVTEGGMPIVSRPGADELESLRAAARSSVLEMVGARSVPARAPETASVS